ncbi:hypothetical protein [Lysinibacillus sp. G4S2]|uniref:hypothetical protein n=1 Tax=Lysinibacillus sp. G4S2 TaxID=3055859 RepID=UPI00259FF761|nr:hypothetical protein [Lysinibacillus sp. G4S2]MDM5250138.1 hypothetical protein [Lysinibacillus sp. G4S2]
MGISVTDETLERATRVKRLIGRPQESAQSERKSTTRFGEEPDNVHFIYNKVIMYNYLLYSMQSLYHILAKRRV